MMIKREWTEIIQEVVETVICSLPIDPNCSYSYGADDVDSLWAVLNFDKREILFNQVQPVK